MVQRRALCFGVSEFETPGWSSLPDGARLAARLGDVLEDFGYDCHVFSDEHAATAQIGATFYEVIEELTAEDLLIVTVLSHGDLAAQTGELYVVGADGFRHRSTRVSDWIKEIEDLPNRPRTLFLLDLCQAGVAARPPYLAAPRGGSRRSWVLAACPPGRAAYDGRFTAAVTNVLAAFSSGKREIHPTRPHLPLTTLAADSKRELGRLVNELDAYPQEVIGGLVDLTEAEESPPFFPNPAYRADLGSDVRADVDEFLGAFIDEMDALIDTGHYLTRASGHGQDGARLRSGCFTGRAAELRRLSRWLDGRDSGALRVVTGSPGVGKSALLGVLVCAAHPRLRSRTEPVWFQAAHTPSANEHLAVIHARQRSNAEIRASIARQLRLEEVEDWSALGLALRRATEMPVLVVDALDEALQPTALARELLALAQMTACRLLVGLRPWDEFQPLMAAADRAAGLIDLDDHPRAEVRTDIQTYVESVLTLSEPYGSTSYAAAREAFAAAVAQTLSRPLEETGDGPRRRWGEFLVAALFVHRLLARPTLIEDPKEAAAAGRLVPRTMPAVLDLDLAENPELRPVLEALAAARGEGMPLEVLNIVLPLFGSADVRAALDRARFYLRQSPDSDGTTLYRLFHQGLADHLRTPGRDGAILDLLLPLVWDGAMPYVRRHAIQYAAAAGRVDELLRIPDFIAHADPRTVEPELSAVQDDEAGQIAAVYRSSAARHRSLDATGRRQVLGVDAVRYGMDEIAERLTEGFRWRPRWATGSQVASALQLTIQAAEGAIEAVAAADVDGRAVVVTVADDEPPKIWDLATGAPLLDRLGSWTATAVACTSIGDKAIAITGDPLGAVRVWDLSDGRQLGSTLTGLTYEISGIVCLTTPDGLIAVVGAVDGTISAWNIETMAPLGAWSTSGTGAVDGWMTCVEQGGKILVASADDQSVHIWDLRSGVEVARHQVTTDSLDISLGRVTYDGHEMILVGCAAGVWLLEDAAVSGAAMRLLISPSHETPLRRPMVAGGKTVAVAGCDDGLAHVIELGPDEPTLRSFAHGSHITAVACADGPTGGPLAITGGADGRICGWNPTSIVRSGRQRPGHLSWISALEYAQTGATELVLSGDHDHTILVHQARSGDRVGVLPTRGELLAVWRRSDRAQIALVRDPRDGRRAQLWDVAAVKEVQEIQPVTAAGPITALTTLRFGADDVAILGSQDGELEVWDLHSATSRGRLAGLGPDRITHLATFPGVSDRGIVVSLSAAGEVNVWDLGSPRADRSAIGLGTEAVAVACGRVRRRAVVFTGHWDGRVRCWDLRTGEEYGPPLAGHESPVTSLVYGRVGKSRLVASATADGIIRIWDLSPSSLVATITLPESAQFLRLTPTGSLLAAMNWEIVVFSMR